MSSDSASVSREHPFYAEYAEAYDLLVADPVEPWVEAVHECLLASDWTSAVVLDADRACPPLTSVSRSPCGPGLQRRPASA